MGENHILKSFDREDNEYTRGLIKSLYTHLDVNIADPSEINKRVKHMTGNFNKIIKTINNILLATATKYRTINLEKFKKYGYMEFRAMGGENYENRLEEIKNTIHKVARAVEVAQDPKSHKEAYLKKLYKLANKEIGFKNSTGSESVLNPNEVARLQKMLSHTYTHGVDETIRGMIRDPIDFIVDFESIVNYASNRDSYTLQDIGIFMKIIHNHMKNTPDIVKWMNKIVNDLETVPKWVNILMKKLN